MCLIRGSYVTILYEPGYSPELIEIEATHTFVVKNGGVPQKGNLDEHLVAFEKKVNELIPDTDYNGLAIIDFELWRPIYRQHWASLAKYRDYSEQIEKEKNPLLSDKEAKIEAMNNFETAARSFMEGTILKAKQMRPQAKWGYYGLPYCFGRGKHAEECSEEVQAENNR